MQRQTWNDQEGPYSRKNPQWEVSDPLEKNSRPRKPTGFLNASRRVRRKQQTKLARRITRTHNSPGQQQQTASASGKQECDSKSQLKLGFRLEHVVCFGGGRPSATTSEAFFKTRPNTRPLGRPSCRRQGVATGGRLRLPNR